MKKEFDTNVLDGHLYKLMQDGLNRQITSFEEAAGKIKEAGFKLTTDFIKTYAGHPVAVRSMMNRLMQTDLEAAGGSFADWRDEQAIKEKHRAKLKTLLENLPTVGMVVGTKQVEFKAEKDGTICVDVEKTMKKAQELCTFKVDVERMEEYFTKLRSLYDLMREISNYEDSINIPRLSGCVEQICYTSPETGLLYFIGLQNMIKRKVFDKPELFQMYMQKYFRTDRQPEKIMHEDTKEINRALHELNKL